MIIWLTALVLLALLAFVGFKQGAIKVAISLIGLFVAASLAMPLAPMIKRVLPIFKVQHPVWTIVLPPLVIFILVMIVFKIAAVFVHRKVDVLYKYKRDDKTRMKWERMNARVGLSLGLVNGAVYFVLLLIPFYVGGYLTTQLASGAEDPKQMQFINRVRDEIHASKADKVVAGYDPAPTNYYVAADIVGLVKHNPLLMSRLSHYPTFLSLGERPEFQSIANDVEVNQMIQTQAKVGDILKHPKVQAIVTNSAITAEISRMLGSDLPDLHEYLLTGKSEKYDDEKILGLWTLDLDATVKASNPKLTPYQLKRLKQTQYAPFQGMTFVGTTDQQAILKRPPSAPGASPEIVAQGTWKAFGSNYQVDLGGKTVTATFENGKILVPRDGVTFVFQKEH